ncbi:MAG: PAS domain S-box protein [Bacteroidota bacterium]
MDHRIQELINHLKDEIYILDQNGNIISVNRTSHTLFDLPGEHIVGRNFWDLPFYINDMAMNKYSLKNVLDNIETDICVDITIHSDNNRSGVYSLLIQPFEIDGIMNVQITLTDKSEQKHVSDRLKTLLECLPDSVFLKDGDGRWQSINTAAEKLFALEYIDWVNKTDTQLSLLNPRFKDLHLQCTQSDEQAWQNKERIRVEETAHDHDGKTYYFDVLKVPVFNEDGSRRFLLIIGKDITEQKKLELEQNINNLIQIELNAILKVSLDNFNLKDTLDKILKIVLASPFINSKQHGGILLFHKDEQKLVTESACNFPVEQQVICKQVHINRCNAKDINSTKKTIYFENKAVTNGLYQAHYNVPIIYQEDILGAMVVYVEENHEYSPTEVRFLDAIADVIAGMIFRKRSEAQVLESITYLEHLNRVNSIIQNRMTGDMDNLNQEILKAMLDIFKCDRAYFLFPCDPNTSKWSVPMEITTKEYPGAFETNKEFPINDELKFIFNTALSSENPIVYDKKTLTPEDYELSKIFSIQGAMQIALHPKTGKPWLIGMYHCAEAHIYTEQEILLFKQISNKLSHTLDSFLLNVELKRSENKYRMLSETTRDMIVSFELDGKIRYMNTVAIDFFGLSTDNYTEKNILQFLPISEKEYALRLVAERNSGYEFTRLVELMILNSQGEGVPFEINSSVMEFEDGQKGILSTFRNIAERKAVEMKLILQNTELQTINAELDNFVYSASHDLRSPLTSVMSLVELTKSTISEGDELYAQLDMIDYSVKKLDNVIKSIIEYSKNKRSTIQLEQLKMKDIFDEIVNSIAFMKGMNEVLISSEIDNETCFISDKMTLKTIISNLVTNAIKYRRENIDSYVKFIFKFEGNDAIMAIEDNGVGIPTHKHKKVFEMFYRNSHVEEGTGLGLYIVKQNVSKLNGNIQLESTSGVGSTFTIRIPNHCVDSACDEQFVE